MTNEELIRGIKNGNHLLKEELYKNVRNLVYKTALDFYKKNKSLLDKGCIDFDDIFQMANIGYMNSIKGYNEDIALFTTYLVNRIQLYLFNEIYPNKKINKKIQTDLDKVSFDNDFIDEFKNYSKTDNIDNKLYIEQLLSILTEQEKDIIIDYYYKGLKTSESVDKYGISAVQIRNIKKRAINKMKEYGGII